MIRVGVDFIKTTLMVGSYSIAELPLSVDGVNSAMHITFFLEAFMFPLLRAMEEVCYPLLMTMGAIPGFFYGVYKLIYSMIFDDPYRGMVLEGLFNILGYIGAGSLPGFFLCFDPFNNPFEIPMSLPF